LLQAGNLPGHLIQGDDDLKTVGVERVKGVKKILLGSLATGQGLDVVEQECVDTTELLLEFVNPVSPERVARLRASRRRDAGLRRHVMDLIICNGTVVTVRETFQADIGIEGGKIKQLGHGLSATALLVELRRPRVLRITTPNVAKRLRLDDCLVDDSV
jgi:hypothetical protein